MKFDTYSNEELQFWLICWKYYSYLQELETFNVGISSLYIYTHNDFFKYN